MKLLVTVDKYGHPLAMKIGSAFYVVKVLPDNNTEMIRKFDDFNDAYKFIINRDDQCRVELCVAENR